jgi:hypothetical protein
MPMRMAEQVKRAYLFNPDEFDQDNSTRPTTTTASASSSRATGVQRHMEEEHGRVV